MRKHTGLKVAGGILVVLAVLGFLTVANDLRHKGELAFVSSVLLAGLLLLVIAFVRGKAPR